MSVAPDPCPQHDIGERTRLGGARRPDDGSEFRIGRQKMERIFIPRADRFLDWAMAALTAHAARKAVLEIEFVGEQVPISEQAHPAGCLGLMASRSGEGGGDVSGVTRMLVCVCHSSDRPILRGFQGTGLGPTLEFFNLVAGELQRHDLGMWVCTDEAQSSQGELDKGDGTKPPGFVSS